ncbi:uncharacterized protein LOC126833253 [Adelges cooleyi]|uniref:uncharacterized protein LOC126833253 n=1 Tax=Adelges cooleyi TaxID=133065 RepID=UPI00217F67AB|nr:uncharacterized protein LOC126833253 [Adelges cooleyi]
METMPVKMNPRGKFISSSQKELIIIAYKKKIAQHPGLKKVELRKMLSKELGIGQRTISSTILEYEKYKTVSSPNRKKNRDSINAKIDEFDKYAIRRIIHGFWFEKQFPTLDKILSRINSTEGLPKFTRSSLYLLLRNYMGFEYVKRSRNNAMVENDGIVVWRRNYLETIKKYRNEGRPIYFMDEMWINSGECTIRTSRRDAFDAGLSTSPVGPSVKGKHMIVVLVGNEDGFVQDSLLCFESKHKKNYYHDEMSGDVFLECLESVLPRLKDNAVLVMDSAQHHSVKLDKAPTSTTKKADIIKWLQEKGEIIDKPMVIAQLMTIVRRVKPLYEKYSVDEFVKQHNKDVLRIPPYHCELNPIQMAWSVVKNHVQMHNTANKLPDVRRLLEEGVKKVNGDMWKKLISHVVDEEKRLWDMDFIIDDMLAEHKSLDVSYSDYYNKSVEDVIKLQENKDKKDDTSQFCSGIKTNDEAKIVVKLNEIDGEQAVNPKDHVVIKQENKNKFDQLSQLCLPNNNEMIEVESIKVEVDETDDCYYSSLIEIKEEYSPFNSTTDFSNDMMPDHYENSYNSSPEQS